MSIQIFNYQNTKNIFYRVKENDNLDTIAKKFGVSKKYIMNNNKEDLYTGAVIFIPNTNLKTYIVQPFDTLSKIAQKFDISIDELKNKNGLDYEYVFVGQKIYI